MDFIPWIVLLVPVGLMTYVIFLFVTRQRGAFFGGKIIEEIGSIEIASTARAVQRLTIFRVSRRDSEFLGLELSSTARHGMSASYMSFPADKADELIQILKTASKQVEQGAAAQRESVGKAD